MRKFSLKTLSTTLVAILALTLALTCVFAVEGSVAQADDALYVVDGVKTGEISVGHISDIHYFPLDYCYQDVNASDFKDSDYYHSTTGDTKLVMESGNILYANIMRMLDMAEEGTLPLYIFATGDLTKNGERVAHRDVANSLRWLQNSVRALGGKYANFQIFATVGNHDLYNASGALYDKTTGEGWTAEGTTTAQWALMYNGLGYPAFDEATLTEVYEEDYWSSEFTSGYVATTISNNLTITYLNENLQAINLCQRDDVPLGKWDIITAYSSIGDDVNQLSFVADVKDQEASFIVADTTVREKTTSFVPVKVNQIEYDILTNFGENFDDYEFHLTQGDSLKFNSKKATVDEVNEAFETGKAVYRSAGYSHLTGGKITPALFDFIQSLIADDTSERTYVAVFHQNLLPHFEVEDDILKDFILYNWEYTAKVFAELGIRYSLTGHQHCSDVMHYTDAEGRTVYDMQTGSFVSLDSPFRTLTIERLKVDGKLVESANTSLYLLDHNNITPLKGTPSENVFTTAEWNESAYQSAMTAYNNGTATWDSVLAANPNYYTYTIKHDDFDKLSYNAYAFQEIYSQLVQRVLGHFLREDSLRGTVDGFIEGFLGPDSGSLKISFLNLDPFKPTLYKMASYLIDKVWTGLYDDNDGNGYGDYEYNGTNYDNVIDWVTAVAQQLLDIDFGSEELGKLTLEEMAIYVFTSAASGNEIFSNLELPEGVYGTDSPLFVANSPYDDAYRLRFQAAMKDLSAQGDSGLLVERLLSTLLNPLFYEEDSLLKQLLGYKFDFTDPACGFSDEDITQYNKLMQTLSIVGVSAPVDNFVLADVVNGALPYVGGLLEGLLGFGLNIPSDGSFDIINFVNGFLADYLVDSFNVGIGGIAKYIVVSYGSDDTPDLADITDPSKPLALQQGNKTVYVDHGDDLSVVSYLKGASSDNNPATATNGRLPGSLTANFDTVDGENTFVFSYYTAEEIFAKVEYRAVGTEEWTTVSGEHWNIFNETERASYYNNENNLYATVTSASSTGTVTVETETKPQYIPLIDLGLLCITHGATYYENEDGEEVYLTAADRFSVLDNSVFLWNKHTVTIADLPADTEFEYRIYGEYYTTDGQLHTSYAWTDEEGNPKTFTFKTAKADGDFEFLAVADPQGMIQNMYNETKEVFDAINSSPITKDYDFILTAGDMVDAGKNFYQWQYVLNTMVDTFANTSLFWAPGNHEGGTFAMDKFFNYTQPDSVEHNNYGEALQEYYSFEYGSGLFLVLDTNDATNKGLGKKQYNWLVDKLENNTKDFVFVLMHKSLFSTGAHANDPEVCGMREQLVPLFDEYGVDMVFGGHDHVYAETLPVGESGTIYVTLGTIGTKFYEYTNDNEEVSEQLDYDKTFEHTLDDQTFGYVKVVDGVLTYNGYTLSALKALDSFNNAVAEGKKATTSFGGGKILESELFSSIELPETYTYVFVVDGKEYSADNLKLGGAKADVDVYFADAHGNKWFAGTITVEKTNFALAIALIVVGGVVLVSVAVTTPLLMKKKKQKSIANAGDSNQ